MKTTETKKRKPTKKAKPNKYLTRKQLQEMPGEDWQWAGKIDRDNAEKIWMHKDTNGTPHLFTINHALRLGLKQMGKGEI